MMSGSGQANRYLRGEGYTAVELPYHGDELSMLILVPDAGQLPALERRLDRALVESFYSAAEFTVVNLKMPRFSYEARVNLKQELSLMGMPSAFGAAADFSGIDGQGGLFITDVIHQTFIQVDENGTEAAAATAVPMSWGLPQPRDLTIDRPFIYLVRDQATRAVLFVGRVVNPNA